jgi:hypothetical protein
MDYIISKKDSKFEYRVYKSKDTEGNIIFSGHKNSINFHILEEILDYKYNTGSNRYFFIDYVKLYESYNNVFPSIMSSDLWRFNIDPKKDIFQSWSTLINVLSEGRYLREIRISKVRL